MRTTLAIDDDVLGAARALARAQDRTLGAVLSDLARRSLVPAPAPADRRNGLSLLPRRSGGDVVTPELVADLRDEE